MKYITLLVFCIGFSINASAQLEKILHQTFEVSPEVAAIDLDLLGDYKIQQWTGNTILIETKIQIWDATPPIFKFFIEEGRYDIVKEGEAPLMTLVSKDKVRKTMQSKKGQCYEVVEIRLMVPDDFVTTDQFHLLRQNADGSMVTFERPKAEGEEEEGEEENTAVNPTEEEEEIENNH